MNKTQQYLTGFTNIISALVGSLLGLRLLLRLFGANSGNDFVAWIYDTSSPLIAPFESIFPTVRLEDGFVLEISTLLALLVYGLLASLVLYAINALTPTTTKTVSKKRRK